MFLDADVQRDPMELHFPKQYKFCVIALNPRNRMHYVFNLQIWTSHNFNENQPMHRRRNFLKTYSPRSTKVSLGYVVKYVKSMLKIYIWAKWDLGMGGGKHSFLLYTDFVSNWLNIIDWHNQLNIKISSYGHKYQISCVLSSSKILVIWLHLLPLVLQKNTMSFISVFCQLLSFSVSFVLFLFIVKPT